MIEVEEEEANSSVLLILLVLNRLTTLGPSAKPRLRAGARRLTWACRLAVLARGAIREDIILDLSRMS